MQLAVARRILFGCTVERWEEESAKARAPHDRAGNIARTEEVGIFEGTLAAVGGQHALGSPFVVGGDWKVEKEGLAAGPLADENQGVAKIFEKVLAGLEHYMPQGKGTGK
jgi:hypothetical protein